MTLDRARRVFASHMAAARTRQLTAYEKRELTTARQMLRRSRRPAGLSKVNPRRKRSKKNPGTLTMRQAVHIFRMQRPRATEAVARVYIRDYGLDQATRFVTDEGLKAAMRAYDRDHGIRSTPGTNPRRSRKAVHNPSGLVRMGKLVEIRYQRDIGTQKGYYRHPFKVRPVIYYRPSDNSIWIKGGK